MDGGKHVEYLRNDEGSEGNGDDPDKGLLEHEQAHHHNDNSLVNGYPHPDEEGLRVHLPTLPQTHVQIGVEERLLAREVLIEDYGGHWEGGVEGRVAEHEHAIVDRNGHVVEDDREGHLKDGDNEPSVDHELAQSGSPLVGVSTVPEEDLLCVFELLHGDI